jgi:2-amino-4-hydroxy-6-hydroxymethyldihydropteridine diphosphokinase
LTPPRPSHGSTSGLSCARLLRAVVGFGANLGDRLGTMRAALRELEARARIQRTSHVYATAPIGPPQPEYLNAAALVGWEGTAEGLLDALLAIEAKLGRVRGTERYGPRTVDLDVLWIEGLAQEGPRLVVPHPRLRERAFAVAPLLEVAPDAADPHTGAVYVVPPGEVRRTDDVL